MNKSFWRAGFVLALVLPVGLGAAAAPHRPLRWTRLVQNPARALKPRYGGAPIDELT